MALSAASPRTILPSLPVMVGSVAIVTCTESSRYERRSPDGGRGRPQISPSRDGRKLTELGQAVSTLRELQPTQKWRGAPDPPASRPHTPPTPTGPPFNSNRRRLARSTT